MKLYSRTVLILICLSLPLFSQEDNYSYTDNISRLELLDFNYFSPPLPLSPGRLINPQGKSYLINGSSEQVMVIIFLDEADLFTADLKNQLKKLKNRFADEPLLVLTVSTAEEDFKDREGRSAQKWGVQKYPTILITDHNFNLRGSSEGIYPDLASEDFFRIIEELILDIKTPGIINTLQ
ncbi:MAG: hypothetical protein PQJ59_07115 [Spirochaetales bacterium]|nr:hypothetical protein [Spirochaetales bacterium]